MTDILNDDGTFVDGFEQNLPEELRAYAKDAKSFEALVRRGHDTQQSFSKRTQLPEKGGEVEFLRKHFGSPEKGDGYGLKKPENWPEGIPFNEDAMKIFSDAAAEAGATPEMTKHIFDKVITADQMTGAKRLQEIKDQRDTIVAESEKALKSAWGDDFDANLETARRGFESDNIPDKLKKTVAKALGVDELDSEAITNALRSDSVLAEVCFNLGKLTSDDTHKGGPLPNAKTTRAPYYTTNPQWYRDRPDTDPEKKWLIERGYDFKRGEWTKGDPNI